MVFYRKYRPQKIGELDSGDVRELLFSVLSSKDVIHAFLFTGPKGLGKTSAARIVAKSVNCERLASSKIASSSKDKKLNAKRYALNASVEPCNQCYQCVSITSGTNVDVLEIDGASNRGIDEIRDLREKVRLSPATADKKVYIIDEVHMLTTEAFNALLKTIEEPPNHVIFVLCTTEPHKLPQTIVSRCLHVEFRTATKEDLMRSFKRIIKAEKLDIEEGALDLIAGISDGSFRDGAKILEEIVLISRGSRITKELVESKYQKSNIKNQISKIIKFLSKKNTCEGLKLVSELADQGVDFKYFIEQLISELHNILLAKVGAVESSEFIRQLTDQNSELGVEEIKELVELLSRTYGELRYTVLPQLPLELAIVEWGLGQQTSKSINHLSSRPSQAKPDARRDLSHRGLDERDSSTSPASRNSLGMTNKEHGQIWNELINKVKSYNHSIAGVLRGCTLKEYDGKRLVIETGYKFHKDRLQEKKIHDIIEKACAEIEGKPISVSVILKE